MQLTPEQSDIVQLTLNKQDILKVVAFAGTGKTTTLIEYAKARPKWRFLYIAFNKSVQQVATEKFPPNVKCRTAHALAFPSQGSRFKHQLIPSLRFNVVKDVLELQDFETACMTVETLQRFLISADLRLASIHVPPLAYKLFAREVMPDFVMLARALWIKMCDPSDESIGMLHDGYLKLYQQSTPALNYQCILLDEAQDTNPVTADILINQPCPKILVGDPHQQIYSFRGATDSMRRIESNRLKYLTQSFRFGQEIADKANILLHAFKDFPHSIVGHERQSRIGSVRGKHALIARTNAAVFDEAVIYKDRHKISFIGGVETYQFPAILNTFHLYKGSFIKINDAYLKHFESFSHLKDYATTTEDHELLSRIYTVEKYGADIPQLIKEIESSVKQENAADIQLTTTHRAKGLEFEKVRLADDFLKLCKNENVIQLAADQVEEVNLIYVAMTRTIKSLQLNASLENFFKIVKTAPQISSPSTAQQNSAIVLRYALLTQHNRCAYCGKEARFVTDLILYHLELQAKICFACAKQHAPLLAQAFKNTVKFN